MSNKVLDITGFIKLILEALKASKVDYMIGGAIAEWAWGEPRATQDLDVVINLPIKSIGKFSKELEKRDMLVPVDIMLDRIAEDRADIPLNAIHLRQSSFQRKILIDYGPPIGKVYVHSPEDLILYKLIYLGISGQPKHARDIAAILKANRDKIEFEYIEEWVTRLGLGSEWKEMLDSIS